MATGSVFIHEKAICESENIGDETRVWGFSHILPGAKIGKRCNIGEGVFIENVVTIGDDCTIKNGVCIWDRVTLMDGVFIGPNVTFTNEKCPRAFLKRGPGIYLPTLVERGATIGAGTTVVCGVVIGAFAFVGAGSVVTRDIPPQGLWMGNPARSVGKVCVCGERLVENVCPACKGTTTQESLFRLTI